MTIQIEHPTETVAHAYADAIQWRGRIPMEPATFVPDWADRPRKWKHYAGHDSVPLPDADTGTVAEGLVLRDVDKGGAGVGRDAAFTLPALGGMLRDTYGLVGRRLAIQANTDLAALPAYPKANWHRGAASGGGLYPVTVYWVAGPSAPVLPGVYHYAPHQHALRPLLTGDVTGEVRAALGAEEGDGFLVLGVKYWQNAFKYNSFCFHAVSMDVGAAAQALRTWARSAGLSAEPVWFFDEARLADLLGLDDTEGVFAVLPVGGPSDGPSAAPQHSARVSARDTERSRRVLTFPRVEEMHHATRQDGSARPAPDALATAALRPRSVLADGSPPVVLPSPRHLVQPLRETLLARRSSFGRFDPHTSLTAEELATTLAAASAAARDTLGADGLVGLHVYANHVEEVPPGTYAYDGGLLLRVDAQPPGSFLQTNYFLANYNLERAGAVVVPTLRTHAVLDAVGDRGYRLVNAAIGAVAQNVYVASTALGLGSGVALGFDNVSYVEQLGLTDDEAPLLIMMLGAERPGSADYRYRLV
jgi:SagB-type dehydrogenase family enzyme